MDALVSICIPNYNMQRYLAEAITSALHQTYSNIEVVIVDNASTDSSWELIQSIARQDKRVKSFRNDCTVRMVQNYNKSISHAQGKYINIISADDVLEPTFVKKCLNIFKDYPELGYVSSDRSVIDQDSKSLPSTIFYKESAIINGLEEARINLIGGHTIPSQMLIRRPCLDELNGFDERFDYGFDIYTKTMLNLNYDLGYLKDKLCQYRIHLGSSLFYLMKNKAKLMDMYRAKLSIFESLPDNDVKYKKILSSKNDMLKNFAKSCVSYAEDILTKGDFKLGKEYLHLAASFWLDIESDEIYQFIVDYLANEDALNPENYYKTKEGYFRNNKTQASSGPPYELPSGSIILPEKY